MTGTARDCRPLRVPQRRDVARSLGLPGTLGKATSGSPGKPVSPGPVLCSLPALRSFPAVASFVLSSGGSGVSPGGRWGAGSRAPVGFPPIPATFWPIPRLSLAGERICRVGGADGDSEVAEGRWRGPGKPQPRAWRRPEDAENQLICTRLFLSLFWLPGFQEINSDRWDPEYCLFPFLPLSPL